ncbi:MAG: MAPEG family protein [Pseudohongiellaceae bacterium]|nr:MAPEG family protein [Pseudohongiellaceae bacterium]
MEILTVVIVAILLQYFFFALKVGMARGKYEVHAPAISGHPVFERYYRVHMNTLEQLLIFLPGVALFAYWVNAEVAAALGFVFFIGRFIYYKSYIDDPKKRGLGFGLTLFPSLILAIGGAVGAVLNLL